MTIVVTWYRERFDALWCAADSRISSGAGTATDSGPKILRVPVVTYLQRDGRDWSPYDEFGLGFAYAGNTLTAVSTYALASACTQTLVKGSEDFGPPSVRAIAELFRTIAEHYMREISARLVGSSVPTQTYLFQAHIFGYCRSSASYRAFVIFPDLKQNELKIHLQELHLLPGRFYPLGSGVEKFVEIASELDRNGKGGVVPSLREMLRRQSRPDVGGYFQLGTTDRSGFQLLPVLNIGGEWDRHVTFLGVSVTDIGPVDGHNIGYQAFSPDVD
jgi:hypothetical protein